MSLNWLISWSFAAVDTDASGSAKTGDSCSGIVGMLFLFGTNDDATVRVFELLLRDDFESVIGGGAAWGGPLTVDSAIGFTLAEVRRTLDQKYPAACANPNVCCWGSVTCGDFGVSRGSC